MTLKILSESAIQLPFSISSYGKVAVTVDQSKIWADRVKSVIGTVVGQRVMRPRFGSRVPLEVFKTVTSATDKLKTDISSAFLAHLPLLQLDSVAVSFDDVELIVLIEVVYSLPNQTVVTTNIGISTISGIDQISEATL